MKKIKLVLSFLLFCPILTFGQISIDSLNIYIQNSNIVDSIFIGGISSGQELAELSIVPTNDACGTVNIELNFKGCTPVQTTFFDSIIMIGYPVSRFQIIAKWDTLSTCPYPTTPLVLDTLIWDNCGTVGLQQINIGDKIKIYPNPTKNLLQIDYLSNVVIYTIELYDIQGVLVRQFTYKFNELNVSNLIAGEYVLMIKTKSGNIAEKVIITR